ncbi:MAG TPA: DICT sensory domain-containing protein [Oculatellaceae cyanobacterium]|jgi:signal transduction histidine kinase
MQNHLIPNMNTSLYQLAIDTHPSLADISVSPVTLKSMVGAMIDLLIHQKLPATLWVKLPPGEVWQTEIDEYIKQVEVPKTIYSYSAAQSKIAQLKKDRDVPIFPIELTASSYLRGEYFLLVLADKFCGVIVAHRLRQLTTVQPGESSKKTQLQVICAFDNTTVKRVLDGIRQAMSTALIPSSTESVVEASETVMTDVATSTEDLLSNWDSLFKVPEACDPVLLNYLWAKQVQRQEEIGQNERDRHVDLSSPVLEKTTTDSTLLQPKNYPRDSLIFQDEFLNHVIQELKMPLTNMKTALKLLESSQLKPTQRQRYMHLLETECDRQNSLITGLMELSQLDRATEQISLQPLNLSDIVPSVVSTYQPLAQEKGIQLGYTVPDHLPPVLCLETWLRQVAINLLHNSIKYTPPGGIVSVLAKLQGDYLQLEFRDTGIGIAANDIPRIFDRFYRGRAVTGEDAIGAGLGLTIVQQLLLRCGGSISVNSKLGGGSNFKVLLPVYHPS